VFIIFKLDAACVSALRATWMGTDYDVSGEEL
jgi:hypothetical protein